MKRIAGLSFFVVFMVGIFIIPSVTFGQVAIEPWAVYEKWSGQLIRADRWKGRVDTGLEIKREIVKGQLVMRYRMAGATTSNTGFTNGYHRLYAANAINMNQIEADIKVKNYTITGCPQNPGSTRIRPAAVSLSKFNDGTSSGPGDMTGDHILRVLLNREWNSPDPAGEFTVQAFLFRCTDSACVNGESIPHNLDMGTVKTGKWFTLRAVWDELNNRFLVRLNNEPEVVLSYPPGSNARSAIVPFADVRMQMVAGNCEDDPVEMDAEIVVDRVRTNESAVIP